MIPRADRAIGAAYDARATAYVDVAGALAQMDPRDVTAVEEWRDRTVGPLLDAGCGPGHWTALLAQGGRDACGIDLSARFIATARARHPGIRFDVASFRELPLQGESVGGVLAWYSLIHTPPAEVPDVLREFHRVLAPGGALLLGFFDGDARRPFAHAVATAYFWSIEALGHLLADAGFEVGAGERRGRTPDEVSLRPHAALAARRS